MNGFITEQIWIFAQSQTPFSGIYFKMLRFSYSKKWKKVRFIPKPECSVFGCRFCPTFFHKNFFKSFWLSTFLKFEIFIFLLFIFHCCGYRVFICFHFNREIGRGKKRFFFGFFNMIWSRDWTKNLILIFLCTYWIIKKYWENMWSSRLWF